LPFYLSFYSCQNQNGYCLARGGCLFVCWVCFALFCLLAGYLCACFALGGFLCFGLSASTYDGTQYVFTWGVSRRKKKRWWFSDFYTGNNSIGGKGGSAVLGISCNGISTAVPSMPETGQGQRGSVGGGRHFRFASTSVLGWLLAYAGEPSVRISNETNMNHSYTLQPHLCHLVCVTDGPPAMHARSSSCRDRSGSIPPPVRLNPPW
jgi:hypothetical protein